MSYINKIKGRLKMEQNTPKQPETPTTSAAKETYKGTVDPQFDKVQSSIGSGKEFDALVQTLKFAIERGDIDKENVHRLAHGLGVKPETLASMVGVDKETISAEDQDDAPKDEITPPDVSKNFKDFRSEIDNATSVNEAMSSTEARKQARELATLERRAGVLKGSDVGKTAQIASQLYSGRRTTGASQAGMSTADLLKKMLSTAQGRMLAKRTQNP